MKQIIRLTESDLHRIVNETVNMAINEVALKGKSGKTYSLHGNDEESWDIMTNLRQNQKGGHGVTQYNASRNAKNAEEMDVKNHPNRRSLNNANRVKASLKRVSDASKDIMAANESKLSRIVRESVNKVLDEIRKPNDRMIGRHKFKGEYYDKNGNPIYTHPSKLDDPEGGTLSDDFLKSYGWRFSNKRGLHGQISDPTRFPK